MNAGPIGEVAEPEDRVFKALGHRDRRRLLRLIADGEVPVGLLAERSELDQPVVSQHLRVLRSAGLVTVRIDNNRRLYSIDFARFAELRGFLDLFWQEKLALLKQVAETPARAGVASAASARSTAVERVDR